MRVLLISVLFFVLVTPGYAAEPGKATATVKVSAPSFIALNVADIDREVAWFQTYFAVEIKSTTNLPGGRGTIKLLQAGPLMVELLSLHGSIAPRADTPDTSPMMVKGHVKAGVFVANATKTFSELQQAGAPLRGRLVEDKVFKTLVFQVEDPEGNIIQLFERQH